MNAALYEMKCLTNLHVGSGDAGLSVIGNEVEKDPVLSTPIIHASGVKGSLRAYLTHEQGQSEQVVGWFGNEIQSTKDEQNASKPGQLRFLPANLLARPVRVSDGLQPYAQVTTKALLSQYARLCEGFGITAGFGENDLLTLAEGHVLSPSESGALEIEGTKIGPAVSCGGQLPFIEKKFQGETVVLLSENDMREMELPVVARNQLNDGTSKNLWYEEIVPHESVFYTIILAHEGDLDAFDALIDGKVIQFGGGASVGCGYMRLTRWYPGRGERHE